MLTEKPSPSNPYPTELDKLVRVLTILSRKAKALQECGIIGQAAGMKQAQVEVQNLIVTEFGYSADDIKATVKRLKG